MTRIINFTKTGSDDNPTYRFAGKDAWVKSFGFGKWYGRSVATVALSSDEKIAVIGWEAGYTRGAMPSVEKEIDDFANAQQSE